MGESRRRQTSPVCAGCTICCESFPIPALGKSAGRPCRHQAAAGCGVHLAAWRPAPCRDFECRYLAFSRNRKPQHVKIPHPKEAGAFFYEEAGRPLFVVFVAAGRAEGWKATGVAAYLTPYVERGFAVVVVDRGYMMTLRTRAAWGEYLSGDRVAEAVAAGIAPNYDGRVPSLD